MKVGEICTRDVLMGWGDETVVDAARRMRAAHVGDLVIVRGPPEAALPVAMLTDRDIVVEIVAQAHERIGVLTIGDVALRPAITVHDGDEIDIAIAMMRREGVRRLPVVDDDGRLVGIVSRDDVLAVLVGELRFMTRVVERGEAIERLARP